MSDPETPKPRRDPGPPPAGAPQIGDVILGRYRVERVLDEGGMGVVLGARHLHLDEPLAIKVMRPELARQRAFVERFLRESQAASRLKTEHVVRVFDVGVLESGLPFMVMELLTGESLSERIQREGAMDPALVVELLLQACDAIAQAHGLGIVHRDLKPDNLFVTVAADGSPCIKVLDFGISKFIDAGGDLGITTTSDIFGSPRYMSPEQMRSAKDVDARSDIWSLGAILYEMLAGKPSFDAASMPELSAKILRDDPPPLAEVRPEAPEVLARVVKRCLEKDPNKRYATVAELAGGLAEHGGDHARALAARIERILKLAPHRAVPRPSNVPWTPAPPSSAPTSGVASGSGDVARSDAGQASIGRDEASGRVVVRTPVPAAAAAHTVPELPQGFHAAETQQAQMPAPPAATGAIPGSTQIEWEDRGKRAATPVTRRRGLAVAGTLAVLFAGGATWLLARSTRAPESPDSATAARTALVAPNTAVAVAASAAASPSVVAPSDVARPGAAGASQGPSPSRIESGAHASRVDAARGARAKSAPSAAPSAHAEPAASAHAEPAATAPPAAAPSADKGGLFDYRN